MKKIDFSAKQVNILLIGLLIFGTGYWTGRSGFVLQRQDNRLIPVLNQEKGKPNNIDFSLFWDAWKVVDTKYARDVNDQDRLYGAISGMVAGLGDPFSVFMKPTETARFNEDISGNFEGIGAELVMKDGLITVVAPLDDSPASRAGLRANDIIIKINGADAPTSLEEAVRIIRGKKGTEVKLTVVRDGKPLELTLTRDRVEIKNVKYELKDGIGIIKMNQFSANTTQLIDEALANAKRDNVKGIVMDLRNNPGGLLNSAVEISSRFMEPGVVVVERDKAKHETELKTVAYENRVTTPMVVLINKGSASASEILSGAMQDSNRAKIVGETSFGKGSVQSIESLKDGSAVRITIAEWLTPKRREINKVGIKPDIEVKLTEEDIAAKRDPQLDKAFELLK